MRILEVLIPARFVLTTGHLVAMVMLASTKRENLDAGLARDVSSGRFEAAKMEFEVAYFASIVCFLFDMGGIFFGTTVFFVKTNVLQILCHFAGGVLVSLMIDQAWHFQHIW